MAGPNGSQQLPQQKFAEDLDELDEALTNLHVLYEKYFLGIDRRPPEKERRQVSAKMRVLRTTMIKNTALKFRVNTLFAKLISFERMWDRTLREIEEGTYKRDLFKARIRTRKQTKGDGQPEGTAPAEPGPAQLSDTALKKLYETYVVARKRTGESLAGLSYDSMVSRIRAQMPALLQKHNARNIEFKVVIKGGKAILKAIPRS